VRVRNASASVVSAPTRRMRMAITIVAPRRPLLTLSMSVLSWGGKPRSSASKVVVPLPACAPTSKSVFAASFTLCLAVPRSHCSSTVTRDELCNRVLFGSCTASARSLGFKALQLRFQSRRRAGSASNC
jgi:hypothetical protein